MWKGDCWVISSLRGSSRLESPNASHEANVSFEEFIVCKLIIHILEPDFQLRVLISVLLLLLILLGHRIDF